MGCGSSSSSDGQDSKQQQQGESSGSNNSSGRYEKDSRRIPELLQADLEATKKRERLSRFAICKLLGLPMVTANEDKKSRCFPRIATCQSGGGHRATMAVTGTYDGLCKHDLLDTVSHVAGLSGGGWHSMVWMLGKGRYNPFHASKVDPWAYGKGYLFDAREHNCEGICRMRDERLVRNACHTPDWIPNLLVSTAFTFGSEDPKEIIQRYRNFIEETFIQWWAEDREENGGLDFTYVSLDTNKTDRHRPSLFMWDKKNRAPIEDGTLPNLSWVCSLVDDANDGKKDEQVNYWLESTMFGVRAMRPELEQQRGPHRLEKITTPDTSPKWAGIKGPETKMDAATWMAINGSFMAFWEEDSCDFGYTPICAEITNPSGQKEQKVLGRARDAGHEINTPIVSVTDQFMGRDIDIAVVIDASSQINHRALELKKAVDRGWYQVMEDVSTEDKCVFPENQYCQVYHPANGFKGPILLWFLALNPSITNNVHWVYSPEDVRDDIAGVRKRTENCLVPTLLAEIKKFYQTKVAEEVGTSKTPEEDEKMQSAITKKQEKKNAVVKRPHHRRGKEIEGTEPEDETDSSDDDTEVLVTSAETDSDHDDGDDGTSASSDSEVEDSDLVTEEERGAENASMPTPPPEPKEPESLPDLLAHVTTRGMLNTEVIYSELTKEKEARKETGSTAQSASLKRPYGDDPIFLKLFLEKAAANPARYGSKQEIDLMTSRAYNFLRKESKGKIPSFQMKLKGKEEIRLLRTGLVQPSKISEKREKALLARDTVLAEFANLSIAAGLVFYATHGAKQNTSSSFHPEQPTKPTAFKSTSWEESIPLPLAFGVTDAVLFDPERSGDLVSTLTSHPIAQMKSRKLWRRYLIFLGHVSSSSQRPQFPKKVLTDFDVQFASLQNEYHHRNLIRECFGLDFFLMMDTSDYTDEEKQQMKSDVSDYLLAEPNDAQKELALSSSFASKHSIISARILLLGEGAFRQVNLFVLETISSLFQSQQLKAGDFLASVELGNAAVVSAVNWSSKEKEWSSFMGLPSVSRAVEDGQYRFIRWVLSRQRQKEMVKKVTSPQVLISALDRPAGAGTSKLIETLFTSPLINPGLVKEESFVKLVDYHSSRDEGVLLKTVISKSHWRNRSDLSDSAEAVFFGPKSTIETRTALATLPDKVVQLLANQVREATYSFANHPDLDSWKWAVEKCRRINTLNIVDFNSSSKPDDEGGEDHQFDLPGHFISNTEGLQMKVLRVITFSGTRAKPTVKETDAIKQIATTFLAISDFLKEKGSGILDFSMMAAETSSPITKPKTMRKAKRNKVLTNAMNSVIPKSQVLI